jgi:hypothetical protein
MKQFMTKSMKIKGAAIVGTVALLGGTAFVASGSTGAYFSDTHTGAISGTIGSIRITPSGGTISTDGSFMDLAFSNMLPGDPQTVTVNYQNTGANAEDVYAVFPNATALSALNNLGSYGTLHLSSAGNGAVGDVFDSANLNDNTTSCGPAGSTSVAHPIPCEPLPNQVLIASNVGPGGTGSFSFTFNYASKLSTQASLGTTASWNAYPVAGQTTTNSADGSGNGLPYEIVATQTGITPGAVGTTP